MILDGNRSTEVAENLVSDIVIVGAGTLGIYLATRILKEKPKVNIIVIESGGMNPSIDSNINSSSIGKNHLGTIQGRYSGLGGTSSYWGGQLAEFEKADFVRSDSKWPICYEEIRPLYDKVYYNLGLKKICSQDYYNLAFGLKIKKEDNIESYFTNRLNNKTRKFSKYFKNVLNSQELKVILNTSANNICFNNNKAQKLKCRTSEGRIIKITAAKFIFASGTFAINQFFLSTQAHSEVPWKSNKNIGKYFQDHLGGVVGKVKVENKKLFRKYFEQRFINGIKVQHKIKFTEKYRDNIHSGIVAWFSFQSTKREHLNRIKSFSKHLAPKMENLKVLIKDLYLIKGFLFSFLVKLIFFKRIHEDLDNGGLVFVQSEQIPNKESYITISRDNILENGLYKIKVHWSCIGLEINAIKAITTQLNSFLIRENLAEVEIDEMIINKDIEFLNTLKDTNHQCGGMRMSNSVKDGVVDSKCKVWDTENVWIAGAAVFPSSSHANSTLTALALAERMVQNFL